MMISRGQLTSVLKAYLHLDQGAQSARETAAGNPARTADRVTLSPEAREIANLLKEVRSAPEIREDRVRELQERIAQGRYDVAGSEVAEQILRRTLTDNLS